MSEKMELKPCPFCGGEAKFSDVIRGIIYCGGEECFGPRTTALTEQDSIVQWNTRASSPAHEPVTTEPDAWRYQRKEWDALLWRYQTEALVNDDFETPGDWLIEPLYAIPAPPQPGRDAVIDECLKAARDGFEDAMKNYVLIGPSGMAMQMINSIKALKEASK